VATAAVAGTVFAVAVLTGEPGSQAGRPADGSQGAGPTEPSDAAHTSAPACSWAVAPDALVHIHDHDVPLTSDSVLIAESCGGGWTGRVAWSDPGACGPDGGAAASAALDAEAERSELAGKLDGLARAHGR
jgi:hypothetical protein